MQRYMILLASFCVMAVAGILYLRPSAAVRFEGELAMLAPEDALVRLDAAAGTLAFSDSLALEHSKLALAQGDFATARQALQTFGRRAEADPLVEEQLSEIARMSGRIAEAVQYLASAYRLDPTPDRRGRLGAWYRLQRNAAAEIETLQSVPLRKLSDWEVQRLVELLAAAGRYDDLEIVLGTAAEWDGDSRDMFRTQLVEFLVEDGRQQAAVETAMRWFRGSWPDQAPLRIAVVALVDRGEIDAAYRVAWQSLKAAPETFPVLLPLFVRSGHRDIALDLQGRWLATATSISDEQWGTLVDLATATGDLRGLRTALAGFAAQPIAPQILSAALLQFLRYQGAEALVPYRGYMTPDFLRAAPLIGAAWMGRQGLPDRTLTYLAAAARLPLTDWDRDIWLLIANRLWASAASPAVLQAAAADGKLRAALVGRVIGISAEGRFR